MSGNLYTFSQETKDALRKFRLSTSRAKQPQAKIYMIDTKTQEIKAADQETYTNLQELGDELPDSSPRFILLSYPMTLRENYGFVDDAGTNIMSLFTSHALKDLADRGVLQPSGRLSVPYVLLYYLPETCNTNSRMSYAGAVELMRSQAEVNRVIEVESTDDVEDIEKRLAGED